MSNTVIICKYSNEMGQMFMDGGVVDEHALTSEQHDQLQNAEQLRLGSVNQEAVTRIIEYMDGLKTVDQPVIDMFQSIVDNYDTGTSVGHVDTVGEWLEERAGNSVFLRII